MNEIGPRPSGGGVSLDQPEPRPVDVGTMARQFHAWTHDAGGRPLQGDALARSLNENQGAIRDYVQGLVDGTRRGDAGAAALFDSLAGESRGHPRRDLRGASAAFKSVKTHFPQVWQEVKGLKAERDQQRLTSAQPFDVSTFTRERPPAAPDHGEHRPEVALREPDARGALGVRMDAPRGLPPPRWDGSAGELARSCLRPDDRPELLSLALVQDLPEPTPELAPMVKSYADHEFWNYTACHEVASVLNAKIFGKGAPQVVSEVMGDLRGTDPTSRPTYQAAAEAIAKGNSVIQFKYAHPHGDGHSFSLIARHDAEGQVAVDRVEGWAGGSGREGVEGESQVVALGFHENAFGSEEGGAALPPLSKDAALASLGKLFSPEAGVRQQALSVTPEHPDALSRASRRGCEDGHPVSEMELTVTIRELRSPESAGDRLEKRVDHARDWVAGAEKYLRDHAGEIDEYAQRAARELEEYARRAGARPDRI